MQRTIVSGAISLLAAIAAFVTTWLGVPHAVAASDRPVAVAAVHYDDVMGAAAVVDWVSERGPPHYGDRDTAAAAVGDPGSRGLSARPSDASAHEINDYDDTAWVMRADIASGASSEPDAGCAAALWSLPRLNVAAKTVDDVLPGVKAGWPSRVADNGKGTVWQAPESTGNANMLRVMEPTERYPNGYVRFYNEHGQPIGLNGKPGPRPDTHIPRNPDGTYDLPEGW